jgi:dUTP pyrophosphatase
MRKSRQSLDRPQTTQTPYASQETMTSSTDRPILRVRRLEARALLPEYKSEFAAGLDLAACLPEDELAITLRPGRIALIPTGLSIAIPPGYEAQIRPRSGLASKFGITLPNAPGTIDADYRGQIIVPLINLGTEPYELTHGMRIAQMVIAPVAHATIVEAETLDDTVRGQAGFGSTGTH